MARKLVRDTLLLHELEQDRPADAFSQLLEFVRALARADAMRSLERPQIGRPPKRLRSEPHRTTKTPA
jgi:hypothetical protein